MNRIALAAALALTLSGCAATLPPPVVDTKGADPARYQADLAECDALASQVRYSGGASEVMGVNDRMRQVSLRMCLVQRGWRLVG